MSDHLRISATSAVHHLIAYVRGRRSIKRPEAGRERAIATAERRWELIMKTTGDWDPGMRNEDT
jgi:hypothetical protein